MSVGRALFGPCLYLVCIKCGASALISALAPHLPRSKPKQKQDKSRQKPGKKAAFSKHKIKQGLLYWTVWQIFLYRYWEF